MNNYMRLFLLFCLLFTVNTVSAQKTVKDLQYPYLQNYAWIRLAEIVPEITDRIILPIGTLEGQSHSRSSCRYDLGKVQRTDRTGGQLWFYRTECGYISRFGDHP